MSDARRGSWYPGAGKRAVDLLLATLAAVAALPLGLAVALAVLWCDGWPVFFAQTRAGLAGRPFRLYKFRTMVRDAERVGPQFTDQGDPRVTAVGAWLRGTSLDELPQLLNVVRGQMSLVGPRPDTLSQFAVMDAAPRAERHSVRPGITGLAQVSGRSLISPERRIELDLEYVRTLSLAADIRILFRTVQLMYGRAISPGKAQMCGICGFFDTSGAGDRAAPELLERMNALMVHRGPDDEGTFTHGRGGIGMRRLSIIDIEGGHQPVFNERGTIAVVNNGEIYNYLELRAELQAAGHQFQTESDTEVLVHLYEQHGDHFMEKANGMFACAIYDLERRRVVVTRDRLGKKPLYFTDSGGLVTFSSDLKPLLAARNSGFELDVEALNLLLRHNFVPGARTMIRDIQELLPGHQLHLDSAGMRVVPYWQLTAQADPDPPPVEPARALEETAALLDDAIRIRMRSDVPVGAFLSGGIDSSLVVHGMGRHVTEPVRTFAIGFRDSEYDETAPAAEVALLCGARHTHAYIDPDDLLDVYREVLWYLEEPHGDTSFVPTYRLAQLASRDVRVVMTGDGGDEVFGGYERYRTAWAAAQNDDPGTVLRRMTGAQVVFDDAQRRALLGAMFREIEPPAVRPEPRSAGEVVRALMMTDLESLLPGNNVVKPDKMGMAWSLEARCPLLDYRLVELTLKYPGELHMSGGDTKYLLRSLAARFLPADLAARPKRQFTVPFGDWIRGPHRATVSTLLHRLAERGWVSGAVVQDMFSAHQARTVNFTRQLRLLVVLELWAEVFIDGDRQSPSGRPSTTRNLL